MQRNNFTIILFLMISLRQDSYESSLINQELIVFLDKKTFGLKKYCADVPEIGELCQDNEESVPQDFSLKIEFNYDIVKNLLLATSKGLTPCANSFSIAFKGGELDNGLQLWKSIPEETSETTYDMPCHNIEQKLYSIFDISA